MNKQSGFLKLIVFIIVALILLKLIWGIGFSDIIDFLNKPHIKEIWQAFLNFWVAVWNFIKGLFN